MRNLRVLAIADDARSHRAGIDHAIDGDELFVERRGDQAAHFLERTDGDVQASCHRAGVQITEMKRGAAEASQLVAQGCLAEPGAGCGR